MFSIGTGEWIAILIIALLLFGNRLPEVMRSIGKGIVELKKGLQGVDEEIERAVLNPPAEHADHGKAPRHDVVSEHRAEQDHEGQELSG